MTALVIAVAVGCTIAAAAWLALLVGAERLVRTAGVRLAALGCPRCGVPIGVEAAAAVAAEREERLRRLQQDARDRRVLLRIDPCWRFACPACGTPLKFDPGARRRPLASS